MRLPRQFVLWGVALVGVMTVTALSGCSGSSPASTKDGDTAIVSITDFVFKVPDSVAPGQSIVVVNADADAHSVTSDPPGAFDATVSGKSQTTFTAPKTPGKYPFFCKFHRYMQATLTVR